MEARADHALGGQVGPLDRPTEGGGMTTTKQEAELGGAAEMVANIVDARNEGDFDTNHGNADDDLLAAVEALEDAIKWWRP
jgi:hypothetical protein